MGKLHFNFNLKWLLDFLTLGLIQNIHYFLVCTLNRFPTGRYTFFPEYKEQKLEKIYPKSQRKQDSIVQQKLFTIPQRVSSHQVKINAKPVSEACSYVFQASSGVLKQSPAPARGAQHWDLLSPAAADGSWEERGSKPWLLPRAAPVRRWPWLHVRVTPLLLEEIWDRGAAQTGTGRAQTRHCGTWSLLQEVSASAVPFVFPSYRS